MTKSFPLISTGDYKKDCGKGKDTRNLTSMVHRSFFHMKQTHLTLEMWKDALFAPLPRKDSLCWESSRKKSHLLPGDWKLLGPRQKLAAARKEVEEKALCHWRKGRKSTWDQYLPLTQSGFWGCGARRNKAQTYTGFWAGPRCTGGRKMDRNAEKTPPLRVSERTNLWLPPGPWTLNRAAGNSNRLPKKARES